MADPSRRSRAFPAVAAGAIVMLAGSNLPTPLYPTYQRLFHLSALDVSLLFSAYAFSVMPGLIAFGPLSDAIGRRRVLLGAVGLGLVAAGLFATARATWWLVAAQIVEGIAMGAWQAAAMPALVEHHPRNDPRRAAVVGSAATTGGAALGPVVAGLLAQYAFWPRVLPFLVEAVALAGSLALLSAAVPADLRPDRRLRFARPSVPRPIRRPFFLATSAAFLGWGVASLFLSLMPRYVMDLLGSSNLAVIGGLAAILLACSAVAALAVERLDPVRAIAVGLSAMVAASAALVVASGIRSLPVMLGASVLAGVGLGLAFRGSLAEINRIAPEGRKGAVMASYYLGVYAGTAIPVIGIGVGALWVGLGSAVRGFAVVTGVLCLLNLILVAAGRRREAAHPQAYLRGPADH